MQFNYPELRAITEYLNDMNDENSELKTVSDELNTSQRRWASNYVWFIRRICRRKNWARLPARGGVLHVHSVQLASENIAMQAHITAIIERYASKFARA